MNATQDRKFAARYVGKTSEFYSGVRPGDEGTASVWSMPGHEFWSFSIGGAWVSVPREALELIG